MKRLFLCLLVALFALPVLGAKVQVSQDNYRQTPNAFSGRSDGIYANKAHGRGLVIVENGSTARPIGKGFYEDFTKYGLSKGVSCVDDDGSACSGDSTTVASSLYFSDGFRVSSYPIGTSTIVPIMTAAGLDITGDLAANEGWVLIGGGRLASTGAPYITNSDAAFYTCADIWSPDVSGNAIIFVGFIAFETVTATLTSYSNYAGVGLVAGDVTTKTGIAGTDVSTDTTDNIADSTTAANGTHRYCTYIGATGKATYTVDGAEPTTVVAATMTASVPMQPAIWFQMDAGTDYGETTTVVRWEAGYTE
jgi:hypothetical protein